MCLKKLVSLVTFKKKETAPPLKVVAWENDRLNYKQFSGKFNTIIKTIDQSFTIISLEGYDGWGKTFFLKKWVKELKQQNEIAAYYNAWDINALDQPLPSFLNFLFEDLFASYEVKRSVIQQFKNINQELFSLNTLGKLISKSPLAMLSVLLDATKEADRKDIGSVLRELNTLQRREENIKDFKTQLAKVVNRIRKDKNIYIMVDNLDVCRPKFVVDFLESIKYMLDVEGLVFIISVSRDKSNVQRAISTILGPNFSLKSFTDLALHLPKQSIGQFTRKLFQDVELPKKSKSLIIDSFMFYAESFSLSLKAIQYCVKKIKLCYVKEELLDPNLFTFLVILQSVNADLYEELYSSHEKALEKIESLNSQKEWEKLKISLEATFKKKDSESIKQIKNILF
ncbi:KAP family P-loop NTPase fold protein [Wolbachia endosymbiont of Drosophila tsacasi]|uniref:KAP family P-loop NTPase fold protein n=1 Tax=Wolbachia endosymbiont of Drosophila tsacasi TaxID=3002579 RepID=UPI0023A974D7|nr:P-loop NTPase fold protein [Wolbachia endosymbiont of Drosophila tsacasi]MDE5062371.1 P-loop NTPase fold protein [Wolbachia endosymbiont of Drosophila tsacasi]